MASKKSGHWVIAQLAQDQLYRIGCGFFPSALQNVAISLLCCHTRVLVVKCWRWIISSHQPIIMRLFNLWSATYAGLTILDVAGWRGLVACALLCWWNGSRSIHCHTGLGWVNRWRWKRMRRERSWSRWWLRIVVGLLLQTCLLLTESTMPVVAVDCLPKRRSRRVMHQLGRRVGRAGGFG